MKNDTEHPKGRFSKLAIASVSLGVLGVLVLALRIPVYDSWWSEFIGRNIIGLSGIVGLILGIAALGGIHRPIAAITSLVVLWSFAFFSFSGGKSIHPFVQTCSLLVSFAGLVGLLFAAAALHRMSKSRKRFKGSPFAILGIVLTTFLSGFWWAETCGPMSSAAGHICAVNLIKLGETMRVYASEHQGRYPQPNQWCDQLLRDTDVQEKRFFCPGVRLRWRRQVFPWPIPKKARCYYAMNPNCKPDSPPDIVLLFETDGCWNQRGGPEILSMENHFGHTCNILFNDGQVKILKRSGLKKLKWKAGKNENAAEENRN